MKTTKNWPRLKMRSCIATGGRILSVGISLLMLACAGQVRGQDVQSTPAQQQRLAGPEPRSVSQIPDAARYVGSVKDEKEAIALSQVEVQRGRPLKALAYVTIGGQPKRAIIELVGYGAFDWMRTPDAKDPVFQMTMSTTQEWHIVKGITAGGRDHGSWVTIHPGSGPWAEEFALPLAELGVTPDGKIAVMKFTGPSRALVFYVPGRTQ